jgi:hypothetical protein
MNDQKEKITPLKNSEDYEKLKAEYETEKKQLKDKVEEWKNVAIKRDEELLEKDKLLERTLEEKEDWKREAHSARKIHQETKQHKEQADFLTEFKKLQAKKGFQWDESQEKWINQ